MTPNMSLTLITLFQKDWNLPRQNFEVLINIINLVLRL